MEEYVCHKIENRYNHCKIKVLRVYACFSYYRRNIGNRMYRSMCVELKSTNLIDITFALN